MSSILTNNAAMTALQTLKGINNNLETTQSQISTGKKIASAKDNSAIWAISKTMEADVEGFKSISDTLGLGDSTVSTAKNAAESTTDLLKQIKGKITDATAVKEGGSEAQKIQTEIDSLTEQIGSVVKSAQINGVNLVNGSQQTGNSDGELGMDVLASLDRGLDGEVTQNNIGVSAIDLSTTRTDLDAGSAVAAIDAVQLTTSGGSVSTTTAGIKFLEADGSAAGTASAIFAGEVSGGADDSGLVVGDRLTATVDGVEATYIVKEGDDEAAVKDGLDTKLTEAGANSDVTISVNTGTLTFTNGSSSNTATVSLEANRGGQLAGLQGLSVTSGDGIDTAMKDIESMIQTSIDAAASFGSSQSRIEIQSNFVGNLMDSLESGIGSLVDANMEEASARLQALQVQQQLGTQSLSIANQAPQSILSLFRG